MNGMSLCKFLNIFEPIFVAIEKKQGRVDNYKVLILFQFPNWNGHGILNLKQNYEKVEKSRECVSMSHLKNIILCGQL